MHKCVIIGVSGRRAAGHADAYRLVRRGKLVAVSTRNKTNLDAFALQYGVAGKYTDYRKMLDEVKPDLVHINTPPHVREEVLRAVNDAGVPAAIVEKPIALEGEDCRRLRTLAMEVKTRVAVNHQLHFHPNRAALQRRVSAGDIGRVNLVDASARLNMAIQGTHMLQAIAAFNPTARPVSVFSQASGPGGFTHPRTPGHFAPDDCSALIGFDNGSRAMLTCGLIAPGSKVGGDRVWAHKRISVYGELGQAHWSMWDWSITDRHGKTESGTHDYSEQDVRAQAVLTESMFDWIVSGADHPLSLGRALDDFEVVLAAYVSALRRVPVALPLEPPPRLLDAMRVELSRCGE